MFQLLQQLTRLRGPIQYLILLQCSRWQGSRVVTITKRWRRSRFHPKRAFSYFSHWLCHTMAPLHKILELLVIMCYVPVTTSLCWGSWHHPTALLCTTTPATTMDHLDPQWTMYLTTNFSAFFFLKKPFSFNNFLPRQQLAFVNIQDSSAL